MQPVGVVCECADDEREPMTVDGRMRTSAADGAAPGVIYRDGSDPDGRRRRHRTRRRGRGGVEFFSRPSYGSATAAAGKDARTNGPNMTS